MRPNSILIGYGRWGKKIYPTIKKKFNVIAILKKKNEFKKVKLDNINWAFVATPENTHYNIVKFLLEKKINVFCEKPLTLSYYTAKKLVSISKNNKIKLYISDIECYKKKKIKLTKNNFITRKKNASFKISEIPEKLIYHDLYLLYPFLNSKKFFISGFKISKFDLSFNLYSKKYKFNFYYNICSKQQIHSINNINFVTKKNFLDLMFSEIRKSSCNFSENNKRSLFALKIMQFIKKKICLKKL